MLIFITVDMCFPKKKILIYNFHKKNNKIFNEKQLFDICQKNTINYYSIFFAYVMQERVCTRQREKKTELLTLNNKSHLKINTKTEKNKKLTCHFFQVYFEKKATKQL